jgi:hypothetical protein
MCIICTNIPYPPFLVRWYIINKETLLEYFRSRKAKSYCFLEATSHADKNGRTKPYCQNYNILLVRLGKTQLNCSTSPWCLGESDRSPKCICIRATSPTNWQRGWPDATNRSLHVFYKTTYFISLPKAMSFIKKERGLHPRITNPKPD